MARQEARRSASHHFHEHAVHEELFKQHMATRELAEACVAIIDELAAVARGASRPLFT